MRRLPAAPAVLICVLVLLAGIWIGGHPRLLPGFTRDLLAGDDDTRVVNEAIEVVHDDYYRRVPRTKLADAAIDGIVSSLDDRFSHYLDPAAYKAFLESSNSAYEGVGILISGDRRGLRIVTVYPDSPAQRAGLRAGDVIVAVDGELLAGKSRDEASRAIRGRPGTDVRLRIVRDGRVRTVRATRGRVKVPAVKAALKTVRGDKIGVVALAAFTSGAHGEVRQELERLRRRGARGYVLDLRHNGGGLVSEARLVASAFLRSGSIVTIRGRSVPSRTLSATGDPVVGSAPLAVLVDADTASASEIVAGALQDRRRAPVVGTRTFGKGVFQNVIELPNGGALDITAGQYFTPSGRNLGGSGVKTGSGIKPDIAARDDAKTRRDEALPVALRAVQAKLR